MSLKSTEKETLTYEKIVEKIKNGLLKGELEPGDKLLSERKLAQELETSRTSVREALKVLKSLGVVETKPGGGTYIKEISLKEIIEPMSSIFLKDEDNIFYLMETRKIIEVKAIELAANRATEALLVEMKNEAYQTKKYIKENNSEKADKADINFHYNIIKAASNPILLELYSIIIGVMRESYLPYKKILNSQNGMIYANQHINMYNAVKDGEAKEASSLMQEHLTKAQNEIEEFL